MKKEIRKNIKAALAKIDASQLDGASSAICAAVASLPEFAAAKTIMLYMPIVGEVDVTGLFAIAHDVGKRIFVPRVDPEAKVMHAIEYVPGVSGLSAGSYGILQPEDGDAVDPATLDFIVVPALAYDRKCHRLGRGGGYYDKFLALPGVRAFRCGVAFDAQILDDLPVDKHDQCVDVIVADKYILRRA